MKDRKPDNLIDKAVSQAEAAIDRLTCLMPSRIWGLKLGTVELEDAELQHLQTCANCQAIARRVSQAVALTASNILIIPLTRFGLAAAGVNSISSPRTFEGGGWNIQVTPEEGGIICDIYAAADKAAYALARYCVKATGEEGKPVVLSEGLVPLRLSPSQKKRTGLVRIPLPQGDTEFKDLKCEIEPITPENISAVAVDELEPIIRRVDDEEVVNRLRRLQKEQSRMT